MYRIFHSWVPGTLLVLALFCGAGEAEAAPVPGNIVGIVDWEVLDVEMGDITYRVQVLGLDPASGAGCIIAAVDNDNADYFRASLVGAPARLVLRGYAPSGLPLALVLLSNGDNYAEKVIERGLACRTPLPGSISSEQAFKADVPASVSPIIGEAE